MIRGIVFALLMLFPAGAWAISAGDVMKGSQASFLYQGRDFKARVNMRLISASGAERQRDLLMLRKNHGDKGEQRYFMYFLKPADVLGMAFMVYKYPGKDDDRWLFVPALNMVRRIAAEDKRTSFAGSDFTYEDVSGRDIDDDTHEFAGAEAEKDSVCRANGCHVVKSTPKKGDADYSYRVSWIDRLSMLPLKEEYYDKKGGLQRVFTAEETRDVKGIPTVTKRVMKNLKTGHRTEVGFDNVDYNIGIEDGLFTERYLRQPPKKWME